MRICMFGVQSFERGPFEAANREAGHEIEWVSERLSERTAHLADGFDAVCIFVSDECSAAVIERLTEVGVRLILLRSAGFNHVDVEAAEEHEIMALRVPGYSPHAVAEHAVTLMLTLNRKTHRAYNRVREQNFSLQGLLGFDMRGKTAGVIGTGKIGAVVCRILRGFDCNVIAYDKVEQDSVTAMDVEYVELSRLWKESDIITLHCPLTPETHHLIDGEAIGQMRDGVMIVNTSRGGVVNTQAVVNGLKSKRIGSLALDVYEEEADLFFRDLTETVIQDDVFMRLLTFPNVLITAHQGFFTKEALQAIAETTIGNATDFEKGEIDEAHQVTRELVVG